MLESVQQWATNLEKGLESISYNESPKDTWVVWGLSDWGHGLFNS